MTDAADFVQKVFSDPVFYVVTGMIGAVVGLGKLYLDTRVVKEVEHRFNKELEDHRHNLALTAEQARFDYQKQLTEINLYAGKRLHAAEAVYSALRVAHGHITGLFGLTRTPTFEDYNEDDLGKYMTERGVHGGKQGEVLALWSKDRPGALKILHPYLRMLAEQQAERKLEEARNIAYLNEIYFSNAAIKAVDALVSELVVWLSYIEFPRDRGDKWRPDRKKTYELLSALQETLRSELSAGTVTSALDVTTVDRTATPTAEAK